MAVAPLPLPIRTEPLAGHRVVVGREGRPILAKTAQVHAGVVRLAGEADTLAALGHPRTVEVVDHVVGHGRAELHLAWVGPHSLATIGPLPPAAAARLVARVADVVADLHDVGLSHRRLTPDHVLLDARGDPVLTGFAEAVTSRRAAPADDVAALGDLLVSATRAVGRDLVLPERRRRRRAEDHLGATLLTLADRARGHGAGAPLSAADLAAALRATAGGRRRPPAGVSDRPGRRR